MAPFRIFSCFDTEHDADLHGRLTRDCNQADSPFAMVDWSRSDAAAADWETDLRERVSQVDVMIVICGEFTGSDCGVGRAFGAAREQGKLCVMLRGRREIACSRPASVRPDDHLYSWIWEILTAHVAAEMRRPRRPLLARGDAGER